MKHGSKQCASVTENVNDFVDELAGAEVVSAGVAVVGVGRGGAWVVAGTTVVVLGDVTTTTGVVVEGTVVVVVDVVLVVEVVVLDVDVVVATTVSSVDDVVATAIVTSTVVAGTASLSGWFNERTQIIEPIDTPATDTQAIATGLRRTGRVARYRPQAGAIVRANSGGVRRPSSSRRSAIRLADSSSDRATTSSSHRGA